MPTVKLFDGREVDSASEDYRHECEARAIMMLPTTMDRRVWLEHIETKRGKTVRATLQAKISELWPSRNLSTTTSRVL